MTGIERLIKKAQTALAHEEQGAIGPFVEMLSEYSDDLEKWSAQAEATPDELPSKVDLERLQEVHQQLVKRAEERKDEVGQALGALHGRSKAIRRYLDPYPHRITIAGKRKG